MEAQLWEKAMRLVEDVRFDEFVQELETARRYRVWMGLRFDEYEAQRAVARMVAVNRDRTPSSGSAEIAVRSMLTVCVPMTVFSGIVRRPGSDDYDHDAVKWAVTACGFDPDVTIRSKVEFEGLQNISRKELAMFVQIGARLSPAELTKLLAVTNDQDDQDDDDDDDDDGNDNDNTSEFDVDSNDTQWDALVADIQRTMRHSKRQPTAKRQRTPDYEPESVSDVDMLFNGLSVDDAVKRQRVHDVDVMHDMD